MGTVTYKDGKWLLDGQPISNPFGQVGDLSSYTTSGNQDESGQTIWNNGQVGGAPPGSQYWANPNSASGNQQLNEATLKELGGLTQFRPGVGGYSEAIDPSKVSWSDKYGLLTDPSNIAKPDEGNFVERYALKIAMAALAATPMLTAGAAGAGGAGASSGAGAGALGEMGAEGFLGLGGAGGSGLPGGAAAYGAAGAAGSIPTIGDQGLLSWTDIAAANPELAALPSVGGGGFMSAISDAIIKNPMLAASLGMQGAGLVGGLLGGDKPSGGGSWGGGGSGLLGGGLNIQNPTYQPNQQTQQQLNELYGGNMSGQSSGGSFGQQKPMQYGGQQSMAPQQNWQNNLYGGGAAGGGQPMQTMAMQIPQGQEHLYGLRNGMQGGQAHSTMPMQMPQGGGYPQNLQSAIGRLGSGGNVEVQPWENRNPLATGQPTDNTPGFSAGGPDPYPPQGGGSIGTPPTFPPQGAFQMFQNPYTANARPQIADQSIDQSVRNSAIGDGFSGLRNGFLYAGGQRMMPTTGTAAQDQATLRQFGVRPQTFGSQYGF